MVTMNGASKSAFESLKIYRSLSRNTYCEIVEFFKPSQMLINIKSRVKIVVASLVIISDRKLVDRNSSFKASSFTLIDCKRSFPI